MSWPFVPFVEIEFQLPLASLSINTEPIFFNFFLLSAVIFPFVAALTTAGGNKHYETRPRCIVILLTIGHSADALSLCSVVNFC